MLYDLLDFIDEHTQWLDRILERHPYFPLAIALASLAISVAEMALQIYVLSQR